MKKGNRNLIYKIVLVFASTIIFQSCKKETNSINVEADFYSEITKSGYTYFQNGATLAPAAASPHGAFKLRFNAIATTALDSFGSLPVAGKFPKGSVIVKEVLNGNSVGLYAVMKKDSTNSNAGSGWLWAEFENNGDVIFSVSQKGNGCIGCHSGLPNRDLLRTFDLH